MNKFFMGCLSFCALALMFGQAIAGADTKNQNSLNNDGVVVIETYSSSVVSTPNSADNNMQPLPGDPGVEVAPVDSSSVQPVVVEEGVIMQEVEQDD